MADVIFTAQECKGLSKKDFAILHEHVLHHIQTSPEIRRLISQRRKKFVQIHPSIKSELRSKVRPLLQRLNSKRRQAPLAPAGRKKR